jgi:hypothetical protein
MAIQSGDTDLPFGDLCRERGIGSATVHKMKAKSGWHDDPGRASDARHVPTHDHPGLVTPAERFSR